MMESPPQTTSVNILDKEYRVSCPPEQQEALIEAAQYLSEKMRDIRAGGKVIGMERIAVMAALNISYELVQTKSKLESEQMDTQEHLNQLMEKMDQAMADVEK